MSRLKKALQMVRILCQSLALILGMVIFLQGFFPTKIPLQGVGSFHQVPNVGNCNVSQIWSRRQVGQVVLLVIDALRVDFVLPDAKLSNLGLNLFDKRPKIKGISEMLDEGRDAIAFVAQAHSPTVTLPRIKALTTGNIPGFIDVVTNFGSSVLNEDNLIGQLANDNWNINFFGDETWIKLFPDHFKSKDGTTSFFVADYTEVDLNVSRHLTDEYLARTDWDLTILHFLGLDHIGHLAGPSSTLVGPKLEEMNDIILKLKNSLFRKFIEGGDILPPLILVLGDHGMADVGGHGGASPAEVLVPVVAISPNIATKAKGHFDFLIKQPDLVPTLSKLTGTPIPKNNLGILIEPIIKAFQDENVVDSCDELLVNYFYNAFQVSQCLESNVPSYATDEGYQEFVAAKKHLECSDEDFLKPNADSNRRSEMIQHLNMFRSAVKKMSHTLEDNILHYKILHMILGMFIILMVVLIHVPILVRAFSPDFISLFHLLHIVSLGSTSFIEEEHQTFYFFGITSILVILFQTFKMKVKTEAFDDESKPKTRSNFWTEITTGFFLMGILKVARCWNQTGDKWSHLPDITDWLLGPDNVSILSLVHLGALAVTGVLVSRKYEMVSQNKIRQLLLLLMLTLVYIQKISDGSVTNFFQPFIEIQVTRVFWPSQLLYILSTIQFCARIILWKSTQPELVILECLVPVLSLLSQPQNSIIIPVALIIESCLAKLTNNLLQYKVWSLTLLYFMFGKITYFHLGNSNSLSSVDVGAGYNGIASFNPFYIGILMAINTYSGPIIWLILLFVRLREQDTNFSKSSLSPKEKEHSRINFSHYSVYIYAFRYGCELFVFSCICILSRYHLFVWTVFSPKLLFEGMEVLTILTISTVIVFFVTILKN